MSSAPAKPPPTSSQRKALTFSPRNRAANSVTANGASMTMAVNSPTGIRLTLQKLNMLTVSSSVPRSS